ncbi:MAG: AroM family protein [Deferribacteraceae bacterium]|jgi:protein AroM|nr:AroM family protein [Deferribacteraceae bacterium]
MATIATLTIGQAPRVDIIPVLEKFIPTDAMAHFGVLDGLTDAEVARDYAPAAGEKVLVSRLKSGMEARLGDSKIEAGLLRKIKAIEEQGFAVIMLLCTGEFHSLKTKHAMLIEPDRVIPAALSSIMGDKQLGILVPAEEQIKEQLSKWHALSKTPVCAAASPYSGTEQDVIKAGLAVKSMGADAIILDCMGYNMQHLNWLTAALDIPVILSNRFMAAIVGQFVK